MKISRQIVLLLLGILAEHVPGLAGGSSSSTSSSPGPNQNLFQSGYKKVGFVDDRSHGGPIAPSESSSSAQVNNNFYGEDSMLGDDPLSTEFRFTAPHYNATVPENSFAGTVILPVVGKMGIWNKDRQIHYSILSGDPLQLFRVEGRQVGDFSFLVIRVRNNERSLNREYRELYKVQIKAVVYADPPPSHDGGNVTLVSRNSNSNNQDNRLSSPVAKIGGSGSSGKSGNFLRAFSGLSGKHKTLFPQSLDIINGEKEIKEEKLEGGNVPSQRFIIDDLNLISESEEGNTERTSSKWRKNKIRNKDNEDVDQITEKSFEEEESGTGKLFLLDENDGGVVLEEEAGTTRRSDVQNDESFVSQLHNLAKSDVIKNRRVKKGGDSGGGRRRRGDSVGNKTVSRTSRADDAPRPRGSNRSRARNRTGSGERKRGRNKVTLLESKNPNLIDVDGLLESQSLGRGRRIKTTTTTTSTTTTTTTPKPKTKIDLKRIVLHEAETMVHIRIIDVDDNQPVFESLSYDIGVNADTPVLGKVAKITAADADVGRNQEIYYSLPEWNDHWSIDPITGVLSPTRPLIEHHHLQSSLDQDENRSRANGERNANRVTLRVRAKNRWNPSPNAGSIANVNIHIRPVNRYAPQIRINRPPQVEVRPYGVIYAIVSIRDPDEGENGLVDLEIKEGDPNGIFRVSPTSSRNEFYIEMSPIIAENFHWNPEKLYNYNLTLRATDRGTPPRTSEKDFQVRLSDVLWSSISAASSSSLTYSSSHHFFSPSSPFSGQGNGQAPIFEKDVYEVEISETAPPHSVVFRLRRPDSKVLLTISSGNEGQDFFLEETSGVLYTSKWLDAETKSTYTLTIDSRDRRPNRIGDLSRRRQSVAKIIVKITDGNDNDPEFETSTNPTQVSLMENEPVGTKVAKISARDRDQGENGYVTYNIANLKPVPFSIDHFTGEIRTAKSFDFEVDKREFQLVIRASDWGQPSRRQSQTTLDIRINDANDNRPLFTVTECFAVIDRSIKFETEIGKLEAIDFDRNDVVSYRMVSGNEDSCFQMDPGTGKLKVMCDLRDVRNTKRNLNVTATDGEYFSDVMTIKVELWDSLKNNMSAQQHHQESQIKSGIKLYSTAQSIFECKDTGVQERFDRMAALSEKNNQRDEMDIGGENGFPLVPSRYRENIHTPSFVDFPSEITVNESTPVGTVVLKLRGRDLDKGYNGLLTFVISSGDEAHGAWDIFNDENMMSATGSFSQEANLVLAVPLDREDISKYVLNITVWDQGKPARHSSKLLIIKVLDNNDCKPTFTKTAMKIKIGEGSELIGEQLLQVSAYDDDEPGTPNSQLSYRLLNDLPEFSIEEKTGIIRLMRDLDRERQDLYELLVVAEDAGTPKLSSIALVTIQVDDKNDCSPKFEPFTTIPPSKGKQQAKPSQLASGTRLVKIMEDWPVGGVVTQVIAKDEDLGLGGIVRYLLIEGDESGDFGIDEVSGVVKIKKELDYEKTSIYNLTIRAKDLGTPSLFTDSFLVVEVYDVVEEELSVSFTDFVTQTNISENVPIGTVVTNVTLLPQDYQTFYATTGGLILFIEGPSRSFFVIDNEGVVRTAHNLDHESHPSHWLSIVAKSISSGKVLARLECFVKVLDINECHPLTTLPSYSIEVSENFPGSGVLAKLEAFDCDPGPSGEIHFALKTSTPYFEVHPESGEIFTTDFPLDREKQSVHIFDVIVTDSGTPSLNSTTQVIVTLQDENDQRPKFLYTRGIRYIPELNSELQRDEPEEDENSLELSSEDEEEDEDEELSKWSDWSVLEIGNGGTNGESDDDQDINNMAEGGSWKKIYRVVAMDGDAGENGSISYRLKYRANPEIAQADETFSIHPTTGEIFTTASLLKPDTTLKFLIEASDGGTLPLVQETELILRVKGINKGPSEPPKILLQMRNNVVSLTTKERAGYTVETIDAEDPDGDDLWYEIVSGDPELYFNMWPESEKLILARPIPIAMEFKLNISVSDGYNVVFTQLLVKVIESERASSLIWEKSNYTGLISELVSDFSPVTTLRVILPTEEEMGDDYHSHNWTKTGGKTRRNSVPKSVGTILYGFHNAEDSRSLEIFTIDTLSGVVSVAKPGLIDRESLPRHVLTVKARDPIHFYMFTRLIIHIQDSNDHAPDWRYSVTELRIPETTAVGSLISQIEAFDMDSGENGRLSYAITFGNIGATFGIDKDTGWLHLDRPLSIPFGETSIEYQLTIQASDHGTVPLSATTNLNILVTLASDEEVVALRCSGDGTLASRNSPFSSSKMMRVRVKENSPPGTYVSTVRAVNSKSVSFEIEENRNHLFWIDPTTGVILVGKGRSMLDRESKASHEIFVKATNSRGATATCRVVVDIIDVNDHKPQFTKLHYEGIIREDAPLGTLVRKRPQGSDLDEKRPLVLESMDSDVGLNAVITYSIVEDDDMKKVFHIDPSTGALLLVTSLDYEKRSRYIFHVKATDGGGLISSTVATVNVSVENVNMKKPVVQSARVEMLIPTAAGVLIHQVQAMDADDDPLDFNITRGNSQGFFKIGKRTGEIRIGKADGFSGSKHVLEVAVTDGRFWSLATITVHVRQLPKNPQFSFRNSTFLGSVIENSTKSVNIMSLTVVGAHINERLQFQILNPNQHFAIKRTSGVIFTTGKKLDREEEPTHNLLVEVHGDDPTRVARAFVTIHVADVNDNAPQFMNLPYVAVVSMEAKPGDPVIQIKAYDADEGENAMIRYELVRTPHGDIYDLDRHSGVIRLRRRPDSVGHHDITIKAYDGGVPTCTTETTVLVKIVSSDQPVFEQQWYETWIPEDAAVGSTALALVAHAKNPILYSIEGGNELDEFGIDYQTGVLYVNSPLDFESQTTYRLTVRATDLVTSSGSNTHVLIRLKDSNDCRPRFTQATYHIRLAEGYMPSQGGLLASLRASDNDTGINAMLTYELIPDDAPIRISAEGERISSRRISRHISTEDLDLDIIDRDNINNQVSIELGDQDQEGNDVDDNEYEDVTKVAKGKYKKKSKTAANHLLSSIPGEDTSLFPVRERMVNEDATSNQRAADVSRFFMIRPNDGSIVLKQMVDYERAHEFRFSVVVKDSGIPALSSTARVVVEVLDVNDESVVFERPVYHARVSEAAPRGHFISKVSAYDPDIMDSLRFAIVGQSHHQTAFEIDEKSGVVTLSQPSVLLSELNFELNVSVTDGVFTSYSRVEIEVEPRNHHAPTFSSLIYEVGCPENASDGYLIATLTAEDPDRSIFGKIRYSIADTDEPDLFVIDEETGEVRLSVSADDFLDREIKASHTLEIVAEDGGGWLGYTKLVVKVIDVNEYSPEFPVTEYRVTVPGERIRSKNPILQVVAVDKDTEFGIRYSIFDMPPSNGSIRQDGRFFEINPDSGEVRLRMSDEDVLKFTKNQERVQFLFRVFATDEGGLHSFVLVTVVLLPEGELSPEIHPQNATFFVKEDAELGSVITTLRVTNIEKPTFRIVSSNNQFFNVDQHGNLLINARLDLEDADKHTVVIWAQSEDGMSVATSQVMVRVFQLSGRKRPPVFQSAEYRVRVAEDFPEGSLLFTVRAIDSDKSNNIKEKYSLATTGNGAEDARIMHHFSVNQDHGWITLVNKLDYERQNEHILRVVATDSEKPFLVSTATVIIQVLNVADCPVAFDTSHYFSSVREDVPEGTIVATVFATDQDVSKSGGIVTTSRTGLGSGASSSSTDLVLLSDSITSNYLAYFIVDGNEKGHFKMNDRGEISVWRRLDYELDQKFLLRIVATDGLHTDYANVTITILDVNDNSPICPSPEYEIEISEGAPIGSFVVSVEASDPDLSAMSPSFSISGGGSSDFEMNGETGVIITKEKLDREDKAPFYNLIAYAEDRESGEACRVDIRIRILDENDHPPKFTENAEYVVTVKEDAPVGALIGKVHADDEDLGVNRKVRYTLLSVVGGQTSGEAAMIDDQFGMDGLSGVISLLRPLDRELVSQYNLTIQATDDGIPPLSSVAHMRIILMDVNDNPPVFAFNYYSASISELAPISTEVTRVLATSKDIGVNADITYDIVGGNGYNHFGIHPKTGIIFVSALLDYERVKEYVLAIRARDGGTPPLASQALVNITLIDMNDNSPVFNVDSYSVEIPEDAPIGASVMQIQAADLDSGLNSKITYQLGSGDRLKHFQIDPSKGIITVASALDREMIPKYSLEVWAVDHGMPSLSSSTTVNIEIQDRNDNPPLLLVPQDEIIVQEDRPIGYIIHRFDVSDADAPPNSQPFSWDLRDADRGKGASVPFTISEQGNLKVAGKLNFQRKNLYRLQVRVFDNGDPPLYSDANVTVKVVDKSQWPPVVSTLTVTAITADETYPSGIPLGKVHASDFDPYDVLVYSLLETPNSAAFTIDPSNGTLKSLTPLRAGSYELGIGVSDGRWTARGDAYVKIVTLTSLMPDMKIDQTHFEDSVGNLGRKNEEKVKHYHNIKSRKDISTFAVVITLKGHTPQSLLTRIFALINAIKEAMGLEPQGGSLYDVVILSVQSGKEDVTPVVQAVQKTGLVQENKVVKEQSDEPEGKSRRKREAIPAPGGPVTNSMDMIPAVDILMAVRKSTDGSFVAPIELVKKLRFAQPQIESVLSAKMTRLTYDICREDSCERGQCRTVVNFEGTQSLITTETLSLITPNHYLETLCFCPPGYGGAKCEKVINACAHSECMSGYICVPDASPKGYACLCRKIYCPPGMACEEDDHCAQQTVSFSGTSFLAYNVGPSLERELTLSLRVKTLYTSGTLLHSFGQFDYAVLEIRQGLVQFSWDLGTGKEVLTVTSISVSDNRWHRVFLQLRDNYAILRVDGRSTQRQKSPGPARSLHTGGIIYIGAKIIGVHGSTLESLIPAQGFVGCMKDLRYGFVVSDTKGTDLHIQEVKHYITPGINRVDVDLDPINIIEDEEIEPEFEKGVELEQDKNRHGRMPSLPLHSSDTDKFGSHLIWSRNISFSCERLLHVVEACRSQPCLNGGSCSEDRTGSQSGYRCECPSRFHGLNCEIDLDPCGSSPCLNGGKCVPTAPPGTPGSGISFSPSLVATGDWSDPQFFCHCPDGTYGARCERGRWCKSGDPSAAHSYYGGLGGGESEICRHHGECEDGPSGPICWCVGGYTGVTCQLDINECERGDACGAGSTCVNFAGGFRCLCPANATGVRCNRVLATPSIVVSDYQEIIFFVLLVFFIIFVIILSVYLRRCCILRQRNSNSNTIPLSSSQIKDKDNRIPIGRDNREQQQLLRNRDSKISNLEVRPTSATSDIFNDQRGDVRSPLDPIKSYGSDGDGLEKQPSFINNLMKGSGIMKDKQQHLGSAVWDANRDDFSKVQNYMKEEINWASRGSKPGSPSTGQGYGFHWTGELSQPANISPVRALPPPDIPDSVSVISHESNNANPTSGQDQIPIHQINLAALPPLEGPPPILPLVEEEDVERTRQSNESPVLPYFEDPGTCIDDCNRGLWPIPHPNQYLLPHIPDAEGLSAIDEEEDCCTCPNQDPSLNPMLNLVPNMDNKPLAIRNRNSSKKKQPLLTDDSESSSLLGAPVPTQPSRSATIRQKASSDGSSPSSTSTSGIASGSSSSSGGTLKKRNSKTTHVTQV